MEHVYILIQDCIHNMSSQFTFDSLLQLSITTKYNSNLIYELITDQPIYYTSTNQIKLFRNIHSLTIPRYYSYQNLSNLTHINDIKFYNELLIDDMIKLTHLTSCMLMGKETRKLFHTNMIKLYDLDYNHELHSIKSMFSFTRLTYFNAEMSDVRMDLNELLSFVNLRFLKTDVTHNLSNLFMLTVLDTLIINKSMFFSDEININHFNLTKIITSNISECTFQNCGNLKYLQLSGCKTFTIDESRSRLQTLILNPNEQDAKLYFTFNEYINLRYLECNFNYVYQYRDNTLSKLTKLNQLFMRNGNYHTLDEKISNNLIYLRLYNRHGLFDFKNYTNLRTLITNHLGYICVYKLTKLEYLSLCDKTPNVFPSFEHEQDSQHKNYERFIDCSNHLNLTYLEISKVGCHNLHLLTKLKTLIWHRMRAVEINNALHNRIKHLSALTCLHLLWDECGYAGLKAMDGICLSNLRLKEFHSNLKLFNLNHLNELVSFDVIHFLQHNDIFSKLTKLTNIGENMRYEPLECKYMHRLHYFNGRKNMQPLEKKIIDI